MAPLQNQQNEVRNEEVLNGSDTIGAIPDTVIDRKCILAAIRKIHNSIDFSIAIDRSWNTDSAILQGQGDFSDRCNRIPGQE